MNLGHRRLNAWSRMLLPPETWTDILKLLPRRTLVQHVQPVNYCFKEICDKNVKSVHIIKNFDNFMWILGHKWAVSQRQLDALAGHDCSLAEYFRMSYVPINYNGSNEPKLAVLRHSVDLFRHCQLKIFPQLHFMRSPDELAEHCLAYLTLLEPTKPSYIEMKLETDVKVTTEFVENRLSELFRHPTTLNCSRLKLSRKFKPWSSREAILDWLHHRMDVEELGEELRCLNLRSSLYKSSPLATWLIEQCVQKFKQSKVPEDRRCFLLTFDHYENVLDNFSHKNTATGEVLLLERLIYYDDDDGLPTGCYRLLRCLAHRMANGNWKEQLYSKLFKSSFDFNLEQEGDDVAKVVIY